MKPFYQRFRLATEENLAQLPEKKPACLPDKAHAFKLPNPEGTSLIIGRCKYCGLKWIFRSLMQENILWKSKSDRQAMGINKPLDVSGLRQPGGQPLYLPPMQ